MSDQTNRDGNALVESTAGMEARRIENNSGRPGAGHAHTGHGGVGHMLHMVPMLLILLAPSIGWRWTLLLMAAAGGVMYWNWSRRRAGPARTNRPCARTPARDSKRRGPRRGHDASYPQVVS
jgi:hypothetical protein